MNKRLNRHKPQPEAELRKHGFASGKDCAFVLRRLANDMEVDSRFIRIGLRLDFADVDTAPPSKAPIRMLSTRMSFPPKPRPA